MTTHTPDKPTTNATKLVAKKKPVVGSTSKGANAGASTPTGKKIARKRKPGKSGAGSTAIDVQDLAPGVRSSMTNV